MGGGRCVSCVSNSVVLYSVVAFVLKRAHHPKYMPSVNLRSQIARFMSAQHVAGQGAGVARKEGKSVKRRTCLG